MDPTFTIESALVHVGVEVVRMSWEDLVSAYITVGVRIRIIFLYLGIILPVHHIEVIPEDASIS